MGFNVQHLTHKITAVIMCTNCFNIKEAVHVALAVILTTASDSFPKLH
jgi:hypothetical protein